MALTVRGLAAALCGILLVAALVAGYFFLVLPALIRYLVHENQTAKLDRVIAVHGKLTIAPLVGCLDSTGVFYVSPVPERLAKFGTAAIDPLLAVLGSPSKGPRAAEVLALIGTPAIPSLLKKMDSGSIKEQENAEKALGTGMLCTPKPMFSYLSLVGVMPAEKRERFYKLISPPCAQGGEPEDVARLLPLLDQTNLDIKYWALNVLGGLGADGEPAIGTLLSRIEVGGSDRWIYMTTFMQIRGTNSYPELYPFLPPPSDVWLTNQILTTLAKLPGAPGQYCRYLDYLSRNDSTDEHFQKVILPQVRPLLAKCR